MSCTVLTVRFVEDEFSRKAAFMLPWWQNARRAAVVEHRSFVKLLTEHNAKTGPKLFEVTFDTEEDFTMFLLKYA